MSEFAGPWEGSVGPDPARRPRDNRPTLALSGGGWRAALFHLGVAERMYELGALDGIKHLTSVSGGSVLAGLLALSWTRLMAPDVGDRRALFEELVSVPLRRMAKLDLRDRAFLRSVLPPFRRPVECLAALLDEHLYDGRKFSALPPIDTLRVSINACNLDDGKRFRFSQDSFGDGSVGYTTTACGELPVATAVAASAAFPIGFAPFPVALRGPYKKWSEKTNAYVASDPQPAERIPLGDGGIYENLALQAARNSSSEVFSVNGGEAVDTSVSFIDGNPITTALRSIVILMGRGSRNVISDFLRDESYKMCAGVIVENTQTAIKIATNPLPTPSTGPQPDPAPNAAIDNARFPQLEHAHGYVDDVPMLLATLRTDFDAFSDLEIEALRYHGASLADVGLRRFRPEWIVRKLGPIGPPTPLSADDKARLHKGKLHKFGDLLLNFWRK